MCARLRLQDAQNGTVRVFRKMKESCGGYSVVRSERSHRCSLSCLGPLTFHQQAVGNAVRLSCGGLLAERKENTFKNGLVFSSRPLKVQERIRIRVEKDLFNWHGALRVGFTTVPPSARSLPLPVMAIPDLTDTHGHWAAPVDESLCLIGSVLEFWVSYGGSIYVRNSNNMQRKLLTGVDISRPVWAMIDIYGQTCSISLLGSEKRWLLHIRRSCPAPEGLVSPEGLASPDAARHYRLIPDEDPEDSVSCLTTKGPAGGAMDCVVCLVAKATITLPCAHRCLCCLCAARVLQQFGNCPLCRHEIRAPMMEQRHVSAVN